MAGTDTSATVTMSITATAFQLETGAEQDVKVTAVTIKKDASIRICATFPDGRKLVFRMGYVLDIEDAGEAIGEDADGDQWGLSPGVDDDLKALVKARLLATAGKRA